MVGIPNFDPKPYIAPKSAPKKLTTAALALIGIGVASVIAGFVIPDYALRTEAALLVNFVYFIGMAAGAVAFLAAMQIVDARWSRPLKRIAESIAITGPVWVIGLLVFLATIGIELYEWHVVPESVHGHKHIWLQKWPFIARNAFGLLLIFGVAYAFIRRGLVMDATLAKAEGVELPGPVAGLAASGEVGAVAKAAIRSLDLVAPWMALFFALGMSLFAFDVVMSLAPHWYSNMFGGWHFASSFWLSMVWIGILSIGYRKWLGIDKLVTPNTYHDLGKLIFAFSMVWAYMFFAQLLPIWYGNMTEEIGFLLVRMAIEPWAPLAKVVGALCFLIPFGTLLSRGLKKMPMGLVIVLGIIAVGVWLERFIVAVPSIWVGSHVPEGQEMIIPLGPVEVGITLGFLGGLLLMTSRYLSKVPAVPVADPFMLPHPDDIHVHPIGDHGHSH